MMMRSLWRMEDKHIAVLGKGTLGGVTEIMAEEAC